MNPVPNQPLEQQVALVTGASRGIGRAVSLALAAAGADVLLLGRSRDQLESLAAEIATIGRQAIPVVCDVTKPADLERVFATLERLDLVVNNAGMNIPEPFLEVSLAHFEQIFDLNIKAAFFVAQYAAKQMVARKSGGVIVNLSSQMGHVGAANRTVYCASKHALEGLTKALAVELAPHQIRVVSVAPTFIETDFTRPMLEDEHFRHSVLSSIPLGRLGSVEDVANAVVFVASPAARMMTGSSLLLDGGWTAR
jgi:NAD(P)-dependent dehydrogenase (short-subunit alcohol dehydrogenase family)